MEASTVVAVLQTCASYAVELGKFTLNERDRQKFLAIQIDLSNKIIQAQAQVLEIQAAILDERTLADALKKRIAELESDQREKSRYQLAKMGVVGNFFAYELRPASELSERENEPHHFLCQPCFDAGKKSVLFVSEHSATCNLCHTVNVLKHYEITRKGSGFY